MQHALTDVMANFNAGLITRFTRAGGHCRLLVGENGGRFQDTLLYVVSSLKIFKIRIIST